MRRLDQTYPLKSTILYLSIALVVDALALVLAATRVPPWAPSLIWDGGGILVIVPFGISGVIISAVAGAAFGVMVAFVAKAILHRYQRPVAELVAWGSAAPGLALLGGFLVAAAIAYWVGEALLFPGFSGVIGAANALLVRGLIYPELVDLYWLAERLPASSEAKGIQETSSKVL